MNIILSDDFKLCLNVKNIFLKITDTFSAPDGTPMANISLDIMAFERFKEIEVPILDDDGNQVGTETQLEKIALASPYYLERVMNVPPVPFELLNLVIKSSDDETLLPMINYAIDQAGFNALFSGSLEGFRLDIGKVAL